MYKPDLFISAKSIQDEDYDPDWYSRITNKYRTKYNIYRADIVEKVFCSQHRVTRDKAKRHELQRERLKFLLDCEIVLIQDSSSFEYAVAHTLNMEII